MRRIRITVGPRNGAWRVTRGTSQPWGEHRTQRLAIAAKRCRTMQAEGHLLELHIKGRDGRVRDARTIGANHWLFTRACTTDAEGDPPATDYACSGQADAALLALIVASIPSARVNYTDTGVDALTGWGLRFVVEEI